MHGESLKRLSSTTNLLGDLDLQQESWCDAPLGDVSSSISQNPALNDSYGVESSYTQVSTCGSRRPGIGGDQGDQPPRLRASEHNLPPPAYSDSVQTPQATSTTDEKREAARHSGIDHRNHCPPLESSSWSLSAAARRINQSVERVRLSYEVKQKLVALATAARQSAPHESLALYENICATAQKYDIKIKGIIFFDDENDALFENLRDSGPLDVLYLLAK